MKYLWIKNKRYYYYETYPTWKKAQEVALYYKKKNKKNKYTIMITESSITGKKIYKLYMSNIIRF